VNQLMLLVQPAHLQRVAGRELDQEQRRAARAALVRSEIAKV
jgi:protein-arginine kinase